MKSHNVIRCIVNFDIINGFILSCDFTTKMGMRYTSCICEVDEPSEKIDLLNDRYVLPVVHMLLDRMKDLAVSPADLVRSPIPNDVRGIFLLVDDNYEFQREAN